MTAILRRLPFFEQHSEVSVALERLAVKPYQIVVWVSVSAWKVVELPRDAPRMPAIFDTGHNHNLSIQRRHLIEWARLQPASLPQLGAITVDDEHLPLHAANVWLHSNRPGQRDQFSDQPPHCLELRQGIAIYPRGIDFPPLPLLGLRALVRNNLQCFLDGRHREVSLHSQNWLSRLLRRLRLALD
ncbi:MAG TPA: hypothetical protein VG013_32285 [Gemmataceae bacterium]|jgi:hypothetical protein|nr:hypothetical protein [Gemmataceae bacterium]